MSTEKSTGDEAALHNLALKQAVLKQQAVLGQQSTLECLLSGGANAVQKRHWTPEYKTRVIPIEIETNVSTVIHTHKLYLPIMIHLHAHASCTNSNIAGSTTGMYFA